LRFDNLGFLGLAKKAGALVSGDTAVENALARGTLKLLLLACDSAERTKRRFSYLAQEVGLKVITIPSKELVGAAIGLRPTAVIGVKNDSFARGFIKASVEVEEDILPERAKAQKKGRGGEVNE